MPQHNVSADFSLCHRALDSNCLHDACQKNVCNAIGITLGHEFVQEILILIATNYLPHICLDLVSV